MIPTTASSAKMPMFIPWARAESDLPKQTTQASAGRGSSTSTARPRLLKTANARDTVMLQVTDMTKFFQKIFAVEQQDHGGESRSHAKNQVDPDAFAREIIAKRPG